MIAVLLQIMHKSPFVFFISIRSGFVNCENVPPQAEKQYTSNNAGFLLRIVDLINIAVNMMSGNSLK